MNLYIVGTLCLGFIALCYLLHQLWYDKSKSSNNMSNDISFSDDDDDNEETRKDLCKSTKNEKRSNKKRHKKVSNTQVSPQKKNPQKTSQRNINVELTSQIVDDKNETLNPASSPSNPIQSELTNDTTNNKDTSLNNDPVDKAQEPSPDGNKNIKFEEDESDSDIELNYNQIVDKFCEYVQNNKWVNIDQLSQTFNTSKEETIKRLRELEKEGQLIGYVDKNGEYFYLTMKELDWLDKLFSNSKKRKFKHKEIKILFDEIVKTGSVSFS